MARGINKLGSRWVQSVTKPGRYSDGGGLYLVVDNHGKRWVFMYVRGGRRTEMGLGPLRDVPLAKARELAYRPGRCS